MELIKSRTNPKIKFAVSLRKSAKQRKESGLFFIEGARLCEDAALCAVSIDTLFITRFAMEKYEDRTDMIIKKARCVYEITPEVSACLSDTKMPQGVFCICKAIDKNESFIKIDNVKNYAALENIQNPDNLGAISRTAEALGMDALIVGGGCDIYNPKSLRASMGSLFRLPVIRTDDLPLLLKNARAAGILTLAAVPDAGAQDIRTVEHSGGIICVIGNEGAGLTQECLDACELKATIPMRGHAESLNAAGAAAIIMWEVLYGSCEG